MRARVFFPPLAFALLLTIALLPGCGGKSTRAIAPAIVSDVHVDAANGADDAAGSREHPFRTLTHALAAADSGAVIHVAPGLYDSTLGEHFPLVMKARQTLVGDTLNAGGGSAPTLVVGLGPIPGLATDVESATLLAAPGVVVMGLRLGSAGTIAQHFAIVARDAGVTIARTSFTLNTYGCVHLEGRGRSLVRANDFTGRTRGLRLYLTSDSIDVVANHFDWPDYPIDVHGSPARAWIDSNLFTGGAISDIWVWSSSPRITRNQFNSGRWGVPYGSIFTAGTAAPLVRGNSFDCIVGVRIQSGAPDLGTEADPGANAFAGVGGPAIFHEGDATILAIGNTWAHDPPRAGLEVVFTSTGYVYYGSQTGQILP